jgi:hypothetical protein
MAKQRSPNYPAMGLRDAVEAVRVIHDKEKKTAVSGEVVAKALGYAGLSGPSRTKIAALKKFGLLDGDERNGLRVSDLAVRILYPSGASDQIASLQEAALKPELFQTLYSEFRDGSDEAIRSHLVNRMDFSPPGAKQAIAAFRDTYSFAGLNQKAHNDSETSDKNESESMREQSVPASTSPQAVPPAGYFFDVLGKPQIKRTYPLDISIPRSLKAELSISGEFKQEDLERLKTQIGRLIDNLQDAFAD